MKWSRNRKLFLAVSLMMIALLFLDFGMVFIVQNYVLTFMFSLLSVIAGFAFYASLSSKNRKLFVVISMATLASLISLLVIAPLVFGEQFAYFSFQLDPASYVYGSGTIEIVYFNGSLIKVGWIGLKVNVTNNYFRPVQIRYNGFEYVMLVYNCAVTDPSDIVNNKPFLIWGAFHAVRALGKGFRLSESWAYNYYVTRRNLSNYTVTLPVGTSTGPVFVGSGEPNWGGQDLNGDPISPGIYYIYCIRYGRKLEPITLNITRTGLYLDD